MKQSMINSGGMEGKTTRAANQSWKYREKKRKKKLTKKTKFCCLFFLIKYKLHLANLQTGVFNSWVRASVPRVIAGTEICK